MAADRPSPERPPWTRELRRPTAERMVELRRWATCKSTTYRACELLAEVDALAVESTRETLRVAAAIHRAEAAEKERDEALRQLPIECEAKHKARAERDRYREALEWFSTDANEYVCRRARAALLGMSPDDPAAVDAAWAARPKP